MRLYQELKPPTRLPMDLLETQKGPFKINGKPGRVRKPVSGSKDGVHSI